MLLRCAENVGTMHSIVENVTIGVSVAVAWRRRLSTRPNTLETLRAVWGCAYLRFNLLMKNKLKQT